MRFFTAVVHMILTRTPNDGRKRENQNMVQQNRMSLAYLAEQTWEVEFDNCAMWTGWWMVDGWMVGWSDGGSSFGERMRLRR